MRLKLEQTSSDAGRNAMKLCDAVGCVGGVNRIERGEVTRLSEKLVGSGGG